MNLLLEKYIEYQKLVGCKLIYVFDDNDMIEVSFKEENFLHLLGLHKLVDIQIINDWQNKNNLKVKYKDVIRKIKNESLSDNQIRASYFFHQIEDRYNSFSYDIISTLTYTNAIINFNSCIINSKLMSDYILFEKDKNNEYNHLAIGINKNNKERFLESFFHEKTSKYLNGQIIVKVISYKLLDANGKILFEDEF